MARAVAPSAAPPAAASQVRLTIRSAMVAGEIAVTAAAEGSHETPAVEQTVAVAGGGFVGSWGMPRFGYDRPVSTPAPAAIDGRAVGSLALQARGVGSVGVSAVGKSQIKLRGQSRSVSFVPVLASAAGVIECNGKIVADHVAIDLVSADNEFLIAA